MQFGRHTLDATRPLVMGVLNVTPDSFFDGGSCYVAGKRSLDLVLRRVEQMVSDGADLIDVGGESTRPGAIPVGDDEEFDRVMPIVAALVDKFDVVISLDTSSPTLMCEGAKIGAGLINDVRALQRDGALVAASATNLPVCLMHMRGTPETMQVGPCYQNAVRQVYDFLAMRRLACIEAGIGADKIIVDPGIGFGKADEHNLDLIRELWKFKALGPVLLGASRKSLLGRLLGRELPDRLPGSLALALIACQRGASILRVHDVAATRDIVSIYQWFV